MKEIFKILYRILIGMMFGSLVYLLTGFYTDQLTVRFRILYLCASGLIGLLSYIFDIEKLGMLWGIIIHCVLTYLIVLGLNFALYANFPWLQYPIIVTFTIEFIIVYVVIFSTVMTFFNHYVKEINKDIKKRKESMKQKNSH